MERQFDDYKAIVNKHLLDFIPVIDNKSISLYDSMKYSLTAGGKRLRPVLLLAACEFAGGNIKEALNVRRRQKPRVPYRISPFAVFPVFSDAFQRHTFFLPFPHYIKAIMHFQP